MRILGRYALVLILEGSVYYKDVSGLHTKLQSGHAILVTPELAHAYGGIDKQVWRQSYIVFDGPQFDLLQRSKNFASHQPYRSLESIDQWNNRLETLFRISTTYQSPDSALRTVAQFAKLLVDLMTSETHLERSMHAWFESSLELLAQPIHGRWATPKEVASQIGLSYENFRKLFTQHSGLPPAKYQRQRKIDRACTAIYRGVTSFKELAEELEFCDVYHFSKAFRQIKGISPSAYRRSVRGE